MKPIGIIDNPSVHGAILKYKFSKAFVPSSQPSIRQVYGESCFQEFYKGVLLYGTENVPLENNVP